MMSRELELAKSALILSVGRIISNIALFAVVPIYTYHLTTAEYGLVDLVISLTALVTPLVTMRLEVAVFKYAVDNLNKTGTVGGREILHYSIRISLIICALLLAVCLILAEFLDFRYVLAFYLIAVGSGFSSLILEYIRGSNGSFGYAMISSLYGLFVFVLTGVVLFIYNMGPIGALGAIAASNFLVLLVSIWHSRKFERTKKGSLSRGDAIKVRKFSFPLVPSAISWWVFNASDRLIIVSAMGASAAGIYAVANKFSSILMVLFPIFGMALTESAIKNIRAKDREKFFAKVFKTIIFMSGSIGVILISTVGLLLPMIVDNNFIEARVYVPILVVAMFANNITGLYSSILVAAEKSREIMLSSVFAGVLNIILNLIAIKLIGLYAAALSTVIAYTAMIVIRHFYVKKLMQIQIKRPIIIMLAFYGIVSLLYYVNNAMVDILNIILCVIVAGVLNRSLIKNVTNKIGMRIKNNKGK